MAEVDGWTGHGRLQLETDALVFRGAKRVTLPLAQIRSAAADDGWLVVMHSGGTERFDLGDLAASWARAITNPKPRIDKLDVKATSRVGLVDISDSDFLAEIRARTAAEPLNAEDTELDVIFFRADDAAALGRLAELRTHIASAGAIWLIHPKGHAELKHDHIVAAAKAAGLIDTKTARFSDTHTALKLVVPRAAR